MITARWIMMGIKEISEEEASVEEELTLLTYFPCLWVEVWAEWAEWVEWAVWVEAEGEEVMQNIHLDLVDIYKGVIFINKDSLFN